MYLEVQEQRQVLGSTADASQTVTIYYKVTYPSFSEKSAQIPLQVTGPSAQGEPTLHS